MIACCGRTRGMCGQPLTNTFRAADSAPATCQAAVGSGAVALAKHQHLPSNYTHDLSFHFIETVLGGQTEGLVVIALVKYTPGGHFGGSFCTFADVLICSSSRKLGRPAFYFVLA